MPPKAGQIAKMIAQTEEHIADLQEKVAAGGMTPEDEAAALQSIEDQIAKIERLQALVARVEALKKK